MLFALFKYLGALVAWCIRAGGLNCFMTHDIPPWANNSKHHQVQVRIWNKYLVVVLQLGVVSLIEKEMQLANYYWRKIVGTWIPSAFCFWRVYQNSHTMEWNSESKAKVNEELKSINYSFLITLVFTADTYLRLKFSLLIQRRLTIVFEEKQEFARKKNSACSRWSPSTHAVRRHKQITLTMTALLYRYSLLFLKLSAFRSWSFKNRAFW